MLKASHGEVYKIFMNNNHPVNTCITTG